MKNSPDIISVLNSKDIFNNSHDAFIISDSERIIRFVNRSGLKMFGYTEEELIGKSIHSLMSEERTANYSKQMNEVLSGKIVSNIDSGEDLKGKKKNGEDFSIELTYVCSKSGTENYFISQIRDISERKTRDKELQVISNALKVITESNRLLIRSYSEKEYLQGICDIITSIGGYLKSLVVFIQESEDDHILYPVAFSGKGPVFSVKQSLKKASEVYSGSPTILAIKEKTIKVCRNISALGLWKYWKNSPDEMDFDSTISVPVFENDEVIGILRVFSSDPFSFDTHEVELFNELSGDISHGIKILRERKKLESTTLELKTITEANRLLIDVNDEKSYLQSICDIITRTGNFSKSGILLAEKSDTGDMFMHFTAYSGYSDSSKPSGYLKDFSLSRIQNSKSPTVIAMKEKRIYVCHDILGRDIWKYWVDSPEKLEFESTIALPIIIADEPAGVLRVFSDEPFYFTETKISLLEELTKDISHGLNFIRTRSAHEKAVRNLLESENRYRSLFEASSDAIFITDAETGIILDANKISENFLGLTLNEIIGMHHAELHLEAYKEKFRNILDRIANSDKSISEEFLLKTKNSGGKAIPVQIIANIVSVNGKKTIQCILRDISEQRFKEEKIRTAQKMEALGTLSGGIAHDINNILSPVIGFTQIALLEYQNREKQISCLNEVLTAAGRAKELVSQILTFCRKSETDKKPVRIHPIVKEVLKLISSSIPENVKLETVIDENCGHIMCDPIQIYQVLINLCTNAFHAMKNHGGILRVCLVKKGAPEIKLEKSEELPFDEYICLIVSDTGCGMNKTTLNRIFEPYFTTKPKGEGSGLGLSVVSGIVKEHGGDIYVRTYPGEGTYFRISFPLAETCSEKRSEYLIKNKYSKKLHILVVDDEPQITFMLKYMIEELGYTSEIYNDPIKALEVFIIEPYRFDMLITDQSMPGIEGTELSERFLAVRPDFPIILNTGYSPVISKKEALKMGIREFMMKPIMISDLSIIIERALKNRNN